VEAYWGQPDDTGDAWVIMPAHPPAGELHSPLLSWDGIKITDSGLPPVIAQKKVSK